MEEKRPLHERLFGVVGSASNGPKDLWSVINLASQEGLPPSQQLHTKLLKMYSTKRNDAGREVEKIWAKMDELGLEKSVDVYSAHVAAYLRDRSFKKLKSVMVEMESRGVERTAAMESQLARAEYHLNGFEAALAMNAAKESPEAVTAGALGLMRECCWDSDLRSGLLAYDQILGTGKEPCAEGLSLFMELHSRCGDAAVARRTYLSIIDQGFKPQNSGARAFVARMSKAGHAQVVKRTLEQMTEQGFPVGAELLQHLLVALIYSG
jgi:hypothetical protein